MQTHESIGQVAKGAPLPVAPWTPEARTVTREMREATERLPAPRAERRPVARPKHYGAGF
jgi:hypothetical protein